MAQLPKLDKKIADPSDINLYDLLQSSGLKAVAPKIINQEHIVSICEPSQKTRNALNRYRIMMGAEISCFNAKIYIDFMFISGAHILYVVNDAT